MQRVAVGCSAWPTECSAYAVGRHVRLVVLARAYSSAPPEAGRGATATNNQAFCGSVGTRKMKATMIELLIAWYSHE